MIDMEIFALQLHALCEEYDVILDGTMRVVDISGDEWLPGTLVVTYSAELPVYGGVDKQGPFVQMNAQRKIQTATIAHKRAHEIMRDIPDFENPVDWTVVSGRRERREFMKKHDLMDVGNEAPAWKKEQDYLKKHGWKEPEKASRS